MFVVECYVVGDVLVGYEDWVVIVLWFGFGWLVDCVEDVLLFGGIIK